ncbi:hypothetical protein NFI96_024323 [Prochilodus magdalenae]|nr:hypothetical protein NFI96_024323 [Prochilodus magdalenae]
MLLLFVVLPLVVQSRPVQKVVLPQDCEDIVSKGVLKSGVFTIYPAGSGKGLKVFCDMGCSEKSSLQAGKWTVIQRRMDGSVNFYRPWDDYKNGFGNKSGEYWIGLHNIYLLTYVYKYELRVDMEDFDGGRAYARYSSFSVEPESRNYRLQVNGYINGGAGERNFPATPN